LTSDDRTGGFRAGRHSLLGHVPQGILGGEAEGRAAV
jgi:hypothetical protein